MIQQFHFDTEDNRLFIIESAHPVYTPKRYRNWFGQLLEHSPYCERDLRAPEHMAPIAEDITAEIDAEGVDHQFFFESTVSGLSVEYMDMDANGKPIGLAI